MVKNIDTNPSIIEEVQSQFILVNRTHLYNLLINSDNLQEALQTLDTHLVPVTKFNDGLSTREDKAIIDYLATNASDKIYVYSNQEQASLSPTERIIIANNEGLTIHYPQPDTARIGMLPNFRTVVSPAGTISPTHDNSILEFENTDTVDVLINNGKLQIDATKTKSYALAMSLVLGG